MKIVLAGGTGFVGSILRKKFSEEKIEVTLLSRNPIRIQSPFPQEKLKYWDSRNLDQWSQEIESADAVINLSGEPIASKRWTFIQKDIIINSRIESTRILVHAIQQSVKKPAVFINASAVGYYGNIPSGDVFESHLSGSGFLSETCLKWESEALNAEQSGVRTVLLRTGIVLGKKGGALSKMLPPFKLFLGGPLGSGLQWFPWIHIEDVVNIVIFSIKNDLLKGPINVVSPSPVQLKEFCSKLGMVLERPSWLTVPSFVLRFILGEMSEMLLTGQKALPDKLLKQGYEFKYPNLLQSLKEILQ